MKKLYNIIVNIRSKKHPHTEQMFGGGVLLTNKKNPLKNILFKNLNELNITLILILGVLFVVFSGYTSYAIFIDTQISSKNIAISLPKTGTETNFSYTGSCQSYTVAKTGYYKIEAWGAQGGTYSGYTSNSKGGYTSGITKLSKGETLYVCVGQAGSQSSSQTFNGGGKGGSGNSTGTSGGGATDIRLVNGSSWSDTTGLNSRIMVAGGGGGIPQGDYNSGGGNSSAGGLLGANGAYYSGHGDLSQYGNGATQISGGSAGSNIYGATGTASAGSFGIGGANNTVSSYVGAGGGGGGYYGGGAGGGTLSGGSGNGAGGGSSFISGYAGVNAITSSTSRTHTYDTLHYSNKYFVNGSMTPATNTGNGKAKITFLSPTTLPRTNKSLDGVRYIKDCMNGNGYDNVNRWNEIQAIYNGKNVAKGLTPVTSDGGSITSVSYITDGDIGKTGYSDGYTSSKCIIIDLGKQYDLDEIAVWHNWHSYYQNTKETVTYVSSDNSTWTTVMNKIETETSQGKRVTAYDTFTLTLATDDHGILTCKNNMNGLTSQKSLSVGNGISVTCTAYPDSSYKLSSLKIDSTSYTSGSAFNYNYNTDKTITATFEGTTSTVSSSAPVINTFTITSNDDSINTKSATLTVTATDKSGSGLSKICITNRDNVNTCNWISMTSTTYTNSSFETYSENGSGTTDKIYVFVKDASGNVSASKSASYTLYKYCTNKVVSKEGSWSSCSASCGGGTQTKTTYYIDEYYESYSCPSTTQSQSCNTSACSYYCYYVYPSTGLNCRSCKSTSCGIVTQLFAYSYYMFRPDSDGWYYNSSYDCYSDSDYLDYYGTSCPGSSSGGSSSSGSSSSGSSCTCYTSWSSYSSWQFGYTSRPSSTNTKQWNCVSQGGGELKCRYRTRSSYSCSC